METNLDNSILHSSEKFLDFSKFGFYLGNGYVTNSPEIKTGFRPKMVMIKAYNMNPSNWLIWTDQQDTVRNERPLYLNLGIKRQ